MIKDSLTLAFIATTVFFILAFALGYIVHWCWPKEKKPQQGITEHMFDLLENRNKLAPIRDLRVAKIAQLLEEIEVWQKFPCQNEQIEKEHWAIIYRAAREYARKEPVISKYHVN